MKDRTCDFCGEDGFDLIGLKDHLLHHCKKFEETRELPQDFTERRVEETQNPQAK